MDARSIIVQFLEENGYNLGTTQKWTRSEISIYKNNEAGLIPVCELNPERGNPHIWGCYYRKPTALMTNGVPTIITCWITIGNIHESDFFDKLKTTIDYIDSSGLNSTEWLELI